MKELISLIESKKLGTYRQNVSFSSLTTYKTGGIASLVFFPNSIGSLKEGLLFIRGNSIPYKIFGNGSNILASDSVFNGVVIKLSSLNNVEINDNYVSVEAGYPFNVLCNKVGKLGLSGLEFGGGIPATVGGAVYMNAGAYLEDVSKTLEKVDILDENCDFKTISKEDLDFSYRHSLFMEKKWVILQAYFKLIPGNRDEIVSLMEDRKQRRVDSQPLDYPSAGSVFRNPKDNYAGKLIENSNLKGFVYGGAKISDKHANFIINYNNAKSSDILYLMNLVKSEVKKNYDIDLHEEQELFNFGEENEEKK